MRGANGAIIHLCFDAGAATLLLLALAQPRSRTSLTKDPLVWAAAALFLTVIGLGLLSLFTPPPTDSPALVPTTLDRQATMMELLHLCGLGCIFLCARLVCRNVVGAEVLGRAFLVGFTVVAWVGLSIYMAAIYDGAGLPGRPPRLAAYFSSPNSAATLMAVGVIWASSVLLQPYRRRTEGGNLILGIGWSTLIPCSLALLLTLSRAGVACAVVTLALMIAYVLKSTQALASRRIFFRMGPSSTALLAGGVAVLALVAIALDAAGNSQIDTIGQRIATAPADWSGRQTLYLTHLGLWLRQPLFGWGLGTFDLLNRNALQPANYVSLWSIRAAHDFLLQWLETSGAIMTLLMAGVLALTSAAAWAGAQAAVQPWSTAILFSTLFILLHGVFDYGLEEPSIAMLLAAMLGMGLAIRPAGDALTLKL